MRFIFGFILPPAFLLWALGSPLAAELPVAFDFEAPDFQIGPLDTQASWEAADPQWEIVGPGLSGPIVPGGDQSLRLTGPAQNAERATYALPPQEDTLFLRLNLRHADEGSVSGSTGSNFFWVAFKSTQADPHPDNATLGFVLRVDGGWGVQARVRDEVNHSAPSPAIPMNRGTSYTVVLKVEKSGEHGEVYDRASVWVNPNLTLGTTEEAAGPADGVAAGSTGAAFLDQLFLRSGHDGALYENQTITLDELMIAGQWEDLTVEAHGASVGMDDVRYREDPARPRDYAGDGTPDMWRMALGQDFRQPSAPPLITIEGGMSGNDPLLTYPGPDGDAMERYQSEVQRSADLRTWHGEGIDQEFEVTRPGDGMRYISARIPHPETVEFFRVKVSDRQQMSELTFSSLSEMFQKMVVTWSTNIQPGRTRDLSGQSPDYESVTRMLVPLALWLSQPGRDTVFSWNGETVDLTEILGNALINGTDPDHPEHWPLPTQKGDQIIVEAPQVALATWLLAKAHDHSPAQSVWNQLSATHRENLEAFLAASGQSGFRYNNNWNLFLVLNHESRKQLQSMGYGEFSFDQDVIDNRMSRIQNLHHGEGWYSDWDSVDVFDDYMPWALLAEQMQYFILRGNITDEETVIPGTRGRSRADILAGVANWLEYQMLTFDAFGGNPEYGRSSTYKFARLRSLVLAYYIDQTWNTPDRWDLGFTVLPESISVGQLRRLLRLHLNHYRANGMIDPVTYALHEGQTLETAPSLIDHYTRDGSRYWALFPLGELWKLPDDDPLWSTPEEPLPSEQYAYYAWFDIPGFFVRNHPSQGHLELFPVRNHKNHWMNDSYYNLYTKFAYSSRFGFTTSSGGRLDQNLLIGNGYRQNPRQADYYRWAESAADDPGVLRTVHLQNDAEIRTLIFFKAGAQVRVHRIIGAGGETIRDGGYALGLREGEETVPPQTGDDWVYHETSNGAQLTAHLHGFEQTGIQSGSGNHSRFASWQTPYAEISSAPDTTFQGATLFYASTARFSPEAIRNLVEEMTFDADLVVVHWSDGTTTEARFP